ncbi:DUF5689 domain-containing protein [Chryseobacterium echinoideorum]|uniref:DUF5689 domain-containing protein n=1 Tax=Chryseobacterium echinoideorum TaxID=1549648 RepID=UPI001185E22A|nr:DUF5689 domain-containing protein [Chryseobacterium echinoideorum]
MKKYNSILKYIFVVMAALFITGCVHDDKYDEPNLDGYQCADLTATMTLTQLRAKYTNTAFVFPDDSNDIVEGYVSSTDETGNIYKTIYIQDKPENPTQGFVISVDAVSTYTKYPQGSKIYIKLAGLALGTYGGVVQLGVKTGAETSAASVSRIPEKLVPAKIFRSCTVRAEIIPKVMTSLQMVSTNDQYIGCLIQMNNAEFDSRVLCTNFAPNGVTVDRVIRDNTSTTARVVRNSGYASFANQILPSGNGKFVGIYSKFNSTYQMYINKVTDLEMNNFPRLDGIASNPCEYSDNGLTQKTVAEVKQLASSPLTLITGDFVLKAKVIANDKTGNLFKYIYVEDATGGIRINIDKNDMHNDPRFVVGKEVYIKLKDLYVGAVSGEIQLGSPFGLIVGRIAEADVYKHFFDSKKQITAVIPTERTLSQITMADVGRWIKIKDLQFIDGDLGKTYSVGTSATNRTLEDCSGNTILLRTSGQADFGTNDNPLKPSFIEVEAGKGDVYAVLSVFNGTYQLWITKLSDIDLDDPRCDGSVYVPLPVLYSENFAAGGFNADWTKVNVSGAQEWKTSNQGNGTNYYAVMNGFEGGNNANEDWLISKSVSLVGKTKAAVSFTSDVRYNGNALQVYATENYTGNPSTTTWVLLPATLDTNSGAFGDWVSSGNVDLSAFLGKNVRIAFKYTSTTSAAATWEIDDFKIKGQ